MRNIGLMLLGLIALPFILFFNGFGVFRAMAHDPFKNVSADKVNDQVRVSATDPDKPYWGEAIQDAARALSEAGDWDALSNMLAKAEAEKTSSFGLQRDYGLITYGARLPLLEILAHYDPRHCQTAVGEKLAAFDAASDARPDDPGLAAIAARAHLETGWAWRGDGYANEVSRDAWEQMTRHYALASERLERFMTGTKPASVTIAHAAHIAARHSDDGGRRMKDIYEHWRALDPGNPDIYREHGFHLLPRWYGSHQELALEAQRAAAFQPDTLGAAPYLWMYASTFDCEPEALLSADLELLHEAVEDHLRLDGTAFMANVTLREFAELWMSMPINSQQAEAAAPVRDFAHRVARTIVNGHLAEIHPAAWDGDEQHAKMVIAALFSDELADGQGLVADDGGLHLVRAA